MSYETRDVFIVKSGDNRVIHKIFGIESEAQNYLDTLTASAGEIVVIDQWPVEFWVEGETDV